jgi:hypothetical protein
VAFQDSFAEARSGKMKWFQLPPEEVELFAAIAETVPLGAREARRLRPTHLAGGTAAFVPGSAHQEASSFAGNRAQHCEAAGIDQRYSSECVERLYEKWFSEGISLL